MWQKLGYKKMPEGTTQEQWDRYEMDQRNHEAWIKSRREFLEAVLSHADQHGSMSAFEHFNNELDMKLSMDAPNRPGYYRANND